MSATTAIADATYLREVWLREVLRVSREVQRVELLLKKLDRVPFDWSDDEFQRQLCDRVLNDPQQRKYAPNKFQSARFWRELLGRMETKLGEVQTMREPLAHKLKESIAIGATSEEEDLSSGWYRNFELARICTHETTSTLDGPTESVIALPSPATTATQSAAASSTSASTPISSAAFVRSDLYPMRVNTGCGVESIGLVMWPAGHTLCEFALDQPQLFHGKRILELGAGIGLTSVILAKYTRPSAIIATDFDERALENIHHNFQINGITDGKDTFTRTQDLVDPASTKYTSSAVVNLPDLVTFASDPTAAASSSATISCSVHTACVDWYHFSPTQLAAFDADIIIAADTSYIEAILEPFARTVYAALKAKRGAIAYLAQAERHPSTFMLYLDALRDCGLTLRELPTDQLHRRFNYDRVTCPVVLHQITLE